MSGQSIKLNHLERQALWNAIRVALSPLDGSDPGFSENDRLLLGGLMEELIMTRDPRGVAAVDSIRVMKFRYSRDEIAAILRALERAQDTDDVRMEDSDKVFIPILRAWFGSDAR